MIHGREEEIVIARRPNRDGTEVRVSVVEAPKTIDGFVVHVQRTNTDGSVRWQSLVTQDCEAIVEALEVGHRRFGRPSRHSNR